MSEPPRSVARARLRLAGRLALQLLGLLVVLGAAAYLVAPLFARTDTFGVHDWDQMQADRYLAVKTIKRYHQFPFWDPYTCGGHTWWGGLESGVNIVSLWFPAYMLLPLAMALRVEVVGCTLLGAVGTWLLAGRFTRSPAMRAIAAITFALDGRWALQIAVGHTWHMYYAWVPWALYFFDRALALAPGDSAPKLRHVVLSAAAIAMMVYNGGIYPLPQCAVIVVLYAALAAAYTRTWRPLWVAAAIGATSFGLAAPRLLPLMAMLRKYPRLVDSTETMDVGSVVAAFTAERQDTTSAPVSVGNWGWHEFGIYIGVLPLALLLVGLVFAKRPRERALRIVGALTLLLGFGRFGAYSPWALLHDYLPIFESQHVPSRWLYPTTLILVIVACGIVERLLARVQRRRWLLEVALVPLAVWVGKDVVANGGIPFTHTFPRSPPAVQESMGPYHQEKRVPADLYYGAERDWVPPAMPAMMANVGVLECSTFPGLGAKGRDEPEYRGEAHLHGSGTATLVDFSPNAFTVAWEGATPGDLLDLNQNWDEGWRTNVGSAIRDGDLVATRVDAPSGKVTFRYRPRMLFPGMMAALTTLLLIVAASRRQRSAGDSGREQSSHRNDVAPG